MKPLNIIGLGVVGLVVLLYGAELAVRWWKSRNQPPLSIRSKR
jgi:hypothetical protein